MAIQKLKIPFEGEYIKQGDTIAKTTITFNEGIDLTNATIKMQLYSGYKKVLDLQNGNGITIVDALTFEIDELPKESNDLPFGSLNGDLEITNSDGVRFTYFDVEYTILKEFTK